MITLYQRCSPPLPGNTRQFTSLEWMLEVAHTNAFLHLLDVDEPSNLSMDQSILILLALMQKPLKVGSVLFFNRGLCRAEPGDRGQRGITLAKNCPGPLHRREFFCLHSSYQALENCLQPLTFHISVSLGLYATHLPSGDGPTDSEFKGYLGASSSREAMWTRQA